MLIGQGLRARGAKRKRCVDIVVAAALLVCLAPLLAVCGLIVWLDDGRPLLFTQVRCGLGGLRFRIVKFRTLRVDAGAPSELGQVCPTTAGVTRSGRLLRRYKLDELPQLWNVIRGEMSLVGPRPTLPEQVEAYSPAQRVRLAVPPGLTGLAQVSGGTLLTWDDRICLDIWYVDHATLGLDLRIIAETLATLLHGEQRNRHRLLHAKAHVASAHAHVSRSCCDGAL